MKKTKIPVSIVIPVHNSSETIERALDSIRFQTVLPDEIIIVDDLSTDNTLSIVNQYIKKSQNLNFKVIRSDMNYGPAHARNIGIDEARHDLICFLDADDEFHFQKLEMQFEIMSRFPDLFISGHDMSLNCPVTREYSNSPSVANLDSFLSVVAKNPFVTPSIMFRKKSLIVFDETKRYCEDHGFIMKFYFHKLKIGYIDRRLVIVNKVFAKTGLSSSTLKMRLGSMTNYWDLYKSKHISLFHLTFLLLLSIFKLIVYPLRHRLIGLNR